MNTFIPVAPNIGAVVINSLLEPTDSVQKHDFLIAQSYQAATLYSRESVQQYSYHRYSRVPYLFLSCSRDTSPALYSSPSCFYL